MKTWSLFKFAFFFGLLFISGCGTEEKNDLKEETGPGDSGYLRSFKPGLTFSEVMDSETWKPDLSTDTLVFFSRETTVEGYDSRLDIYLAFDDYGLFEVQVDCYPSRAEGLKSIFDIWHESLSKAFGKADTVLFATRWTTYSPSNNTIEVTLSIESDDLGHRFVSMNYLEPLDDAY